MKRLVNLGAAFLSAATVLPCLFSFPVNAATNVKIDANNFPNATFRSIIKNDFDKDNNGYLTDNELVYATNIHCENQGIDDITGVEYFYNLEGLWCKGNHLSSWDLSQNKHLKGVWCSFNDFTSLSFPGNDELEWVYCFECDLYSLDLSNNPNLAYLECNNNPNLSRLDLSNNPKLENLFCSKCGLTYLDVSNCPLLCDLTCYENNLTTLDVSNNLLLKRLDYWWNENLGNVDVTMLKDLEYLNCAKTALTKIDVTHNPELFELVCGYNDGLTSIDLSKNPKLAYFACECDVNLKSLDLSHNPRLYYLLAFGLTKIKWSDEGIDISKNSRLCKAYNEGVYVHETEKLGYVYSKTIDYGGSSDPFDELRHCVCFDDDTKITAKYNGTDVPDSVIDKNDGHSNSSTFSTRGEAIQALYEKAGSPKVSGTSRFTDISGSPYANAIKWGEQNNICFGFPNISSNTFCPNDLVSRQDFALMAHRFAGLMNFGTAMDYGRTDWFPDFKEIDFYAWVPFTWAIQFGVVTPINDYLYPKGRMTKNELSAGVDKIFHLDQAASYSARVGGNYGADYVAPGGGSNSGGGSNGGGYGGYTAGTTRPSGSKSGSGSGSSSSSKTPVIDIKVDPNAKDGTFEDFVERLYNIALGRNSEADGKNYWCEHVGNGDLTGADCAKFFLTSQEFKDRGLNDADFVRILYWTFFNRDAANDPDGYKFWLDSLDTSGRDTVVDCFVNSTEWCNVCASYGVKSGATRAKATIASNNAIGFATRLYTKCLGRDPEQDGLNFWSLGLTNLELTGSQAAHQFFTCKEFNDHNFDNKELLTRMYRTFMGREPDDAGLTYWIDKMNNGMTKEQALDEFVRSQEFTQICKDYAIDRG
ncbi:MAG: DUF4214 domain-containing protein [Clostridiales bacterium]|nr:DUF4214 domain-containing protein [Clostridiales bacterium]